MDRSCLNCKRMEQTDCECPCECSLYRSECQLQDSNSNDMEVCPAPLEQGSSLTSAWSNGALRSCQTFSCKNFGSRSDCMGVVGCQWCELSGDGETRLQQPYCTDIGICFRGVLGSIVPYGDGIYSKSKKPYFFLINFKFYVMLFLDFYLFIYLFKSSLKLFLEIYNLIFELKMHWCSF